MATASLFFPRNLGRLHSFLFFSSFLLCLSVTATDTLLPGQDISGNKTLISPNQVFELGFFKTGSSSANYYLGIWFRDDPYQKSIWVANREYPIPDSSGVLAIRYDGNLVIKDRRLIPVLVNPVMLANSNGTHATLLDSGNFVLVDGESKSVVWESFFYPSDTLLPGMRLGWFNLGTDKLRDQFLVSWQTPSVPSTGSFALGLNKNNQTELRVWHTEVSREIGYWDGRIFKFLYNSSLDDYNFSYANSSDEIYFTFTNRRNDSISWFVLTPLGEIQAFTMIGKEISMVYSPICENISSSGATNCFIEQPLSCGNGNNFSKIEGAMLNPTAFNESDHLGISDCEIMCRTNCSCTGFASYRDDGTGCVFYYEDISSIVDHIGQGNATIFIRGNATKTADQDPRRSGSGKKRLLWVIGIIPVVILVIFVAMFISRGKCSTWLVAAWKENRTSTNRSLELFLQQLGSARGSSNSTSRLDSVRKRDHELPILSFSCVTTSTNNFSPANKLGEGGFGPVYKGTLLGHEFAVKRLSRKSGQGIEEFKNEVQLISKLQHRNLVKLLGCCIEREEKILIYEYMANKSLDSFLSVYPNKKQLLDLRKRVSIIEGIVQGLLYLHKYSRLRIIHRDLKTSNILLDDDMNPKISDFGMARIFGENEVRGRTNKVVGTYGYMSPEYAVHGLFSTMSDVFSFGVIMLEIVSGRRNTTFSSLDHSLNLLEYAWELWCSSRGIELIDPVVADTSSVSKLLVCLHIALLCVQERPENRPSMSDIVTVLSNENADLPRPKKPAFSAHIDSCNSLHQQDCSTNDVSYSVLEAR
ncbi:LOW QUALITY PROTEIN: receptor-like serine/threonine-protein kinase SD1-8 [Eucalyptus grandis]|uniref:LOW QUALITY PROTEIN: receptor-like serine/threonine-protein kinase SD1-8 n=1 Tax=Eucalyptus grandis TaxID=71139 RepID=UPI00192F047C|nr:LOW QUALITY PROTEIN: receptor-like serine/threonine-protein kinase SD1-8 [Eucalyptus grandis]